SSSAITVAATGIDRRSTCFVQRYQNVSVTARAAGSGRRSSRRPNRRMSSASSRVPSTAMAAGVTTTAATAASATTATPAYASDLRKYIGNSAMVAIDSDTVSAENSTVRPA